MGNITWDQGATALDGFERTVRVALSFGTLAGVLTPTIANRMEWVRNLTFSLWIIDDARSIYKGSSFKGEGVEQVRDSAQIVMNSLVSLYFFAPTVSERFSWTSPTCDAAWITTCVLNVHLKEGADQKTACFDTLYALAVCLNMKLDFLNRDLHPVHLFSALSGAAGLYSSFGAK